MLQTARHSAVGDTELSVLAADAGLILAAAITPGPNNLVVLRIAAARGLQAAAPAMAGVVMGGLALLALAQAGLGALLDAYAWLRMAIVLSGGAYLAWLGFALVWQSYCAPAEFTRREPATADGAVALCVLQFTNPKSWVLVLTVTSATPSGAVGGGQPVEIAMLFAMFAVIPVICLLVWAAFGRAAWLLLRDATARARFDRTMGILLAASAIALVIDR
jgi:threonine/homoserine/homoserine lactone efflux protein